MSELRTDRDVEQALRAWMEEVAPSRPPTRLLEGTFAETMRSRQARAYPWTTTVQIGRLGRKATVSGAWVLLVVLGMLLAAAMALGLVGGGLRVTTQPLPSATPTQAPTPSMSLPAAISVTPEAKVAIQAPIALVALDRTLWAMAPGRLDRIDTVANAVTGSLTLGAASDLYNGLAANAAGLWATDSAAALAYRVDPRTLKVVAKIPAGLSTKGVVATTDAVWIADVHGGTVLRIDPATNKVVATIMVGPAGSSGPNWLANGLGSIWVDIPNNGTIVRIDAATNKVLATIAAPTNAVPCGGIGVSDTAVWVTGCSAATSVIRIDPTSNEVVATVELGGFGFNPTLIKGAPWISLDTGDASSGKLIRIEPTTNAIDRVLAPGTAFGGGGDIVIAAGSAWVLDGYNNAVIRLPLTAFEP